MKKIGITFVILITIILIFSIVLPHKKEKVLLSLPNTQNPNHFTTEVIIDDLYVLPSRNIQIKNDYSSIITMTLTKEDIPLYQRCNLSEKEFEFFARVVTAEDNGNHDNDYENQVAIACVIWNRLDSAKWPNTITKVLTESGQFSTVKRGDCTTEACNNARIAIVDAYENRPLPKNVYYFNCDDFFSGLPEYKKISDNYFSYG